MTGATGERPLRLKTTVDIADAVQGLADLGESFRGADTGGRLACGHRGNVYESKHRESSRGPCAVCGKVVWTCRPHFDLVRIAGVAHVPCWKRHQGQRAGGAA